MKKMSSMSPSEVSFERALSEYIYFLLFCVLCMWISTTSYENQWTKQTAGCWTKAANVYIVKVNTKKKKTNGVSQYSNQPTIWFINLKKRRHILESV